MGVFSLLEPLAMPRISGLKDKQQCESSDHRSMSRSGLTVCCRICDALQAEGKKARRPRPHNKTPPYVTARPEITHRKIQGQDGEKLRFVVLATDGCKYLALLDPNKAVLTMF